MSARMPYEEAFHAGIPFNEFLEATVKNRSLWHGVAARVTVSDEAIDRARATREGTRLLVLADDWCGDAVNTVPVVAALADTVGVELRIVEREAYPEIMDAHLTNGARSIPVVIRLDGEGQCQGWWGPRPGELQAWFEAEGRALPTDERYKRLRRWYARDRGRSTANEVARLLSPERQKSGEPEASTHPCPDEQAA